MSSPEERRRKTPVDRFRRILSDDSEKPQLGEARRQPVLNLPKTVESRPTEPSLAASQPERDAGPLLSSRGRALQVFWTIASSVSLAVNVILLLALITVLRDLGHLGAASGGSGLLGGLYTNFERMDQAHIRTTIPLRTSIPLNLSIPIQTTTGITLAEDASIPGAHVRINTALFNIDAPASVTLPAGTSLNVKLNMDLPIQGEVPVSVDVPVDIPVQDTELHPAILGLQDTIKPLYCMVDPTARTASGELVCR